MRHLNILSIRAECLWNAKVVFANWTNRNLLNLFFHSFTEWFSKSWRTELLLQRGTGGTIHVTFKRHLHHIQTFCAVSGWKHDIVFLRKGMESEIAACGVNTHPTFISGKQVLPGFLLLEKTCRSWLTGDKSVTKAIFMLFYVKKIFISCLSTLPWGTQGSSHP